MSFAGTHTALVTPFRGGKFDIFDVIDGEVRTAGHRGHGQARDRDELGDGWNLQPHDPVRTGCGRCRIFRRPHLFALFQNNFTPCLKWLCTS